LDQDVIEKI